MDKQIIHTLLHLHDLLARVQQPWLIIGTTSLMLNGFDVKPNDIDILTDTAGANAISEILKPYQVDVQLKDSHKFRSRFSRYVVNNISIEIMGNLEVKTENGWVLLSNVITDPLHIKIAEKVFKTPSNANQIAIYKLFNRTKDEQIIAAISARLS